MTRTTAPISTDTTLIDRRSHPRAGGPQPPSRLSWRVLAQVSVGAGGSPPTTEFTVASTLDDGPAAFLRGWAAIEGLQLGLYLAAACPPAVEGTPVAPADATPVAGLHPARASGGSR